MGNEGIALEAKMSSVLGICSFRAFLCNCKVLNITETEMKALVGRNGYLKRIGEVVRTADDKRLTESQLSEMLGLDSIQSLIRKRKLQWVAHCARRGNKDLTWKRMV